MPLKSSEVRAHCHYPVCLIADGPAVGVHSGIDEAGNNKTYAYTPSAHAISSASLPATILCVTSECRLPYRAE